MRAGLRKPLNWALAAVYGATSVLFLAVALSNTLYYPELVSGFSLPLLRNAPCGAVRRYTGYVLADRKGLFRSSQVKQGLLDLLVQAEGRGIRLCYDPKLVLPFLGEEAQRRYGLDESEPFGPLSENLVLSRRDPALIKAVFDRYRISEPHVGHSLCWRLETQYPATEDYTSIRKTYCPAQNSTKPEPIFTPEQRRKQAFDQILEDSRRGTL